MLSVENRRREDNYGAVTFDSTGQYATERMFLFLKKMIFLSQSFMYLCLCEIEKCYYPLLVGLGHTACEQGESEL